MSLCMIDWELFLNEFDCLFWLSTIKLTVLNNEVLFWWWKDTCIIWFVVWKSIDVNDWMMKLMSYIWDNVWVVFVCVH